MKFLRFVSRESAGADALRLAVCAIVFTHGIHRFMTGEVAGLGDLLRDEHIPFARVDAWLITLAETVGTLLMAMRLLVLPVSLSLSFVYLTGILMFNRHNGFFVVGAGEGGWEYNALLITCLLVTAWEDRSAESSAAIEKETDSRPMYKTKVGGSMVKRFIRVFGMAAVAGLIGATSHSFAIAAGGASALAAKMDTMPALPPAATYKVDPVHSFTYFGARHHVVGLVRGRFDKVTGTITSSKDPAACGVDIAIDVSSLSTQNSQRDADILSDAYFNVSKFPTMTYRGMGLRRASQNSWVMDGSLTLHGVTKVVPLTFTYNGVFADGEPNAPPRMAFHATAAVKRADFGMGARDNLEELGNLTTPDVAIEIDVEADAMPAPK